MVKQEPLDGNVPGRAPARGAIVNIASQLGIVSKERMGMLPYFLIMYGISNEIIQDHIVHPKQLSFR
jgi:hypothetical protein